MVRLNIRLISLSLLLSVMLISLFIGIGTSRHNDVISFMAEFDNQTDIYLYDPFQQELINITETNFPEWSFGWSSSGALLYTAAVNPSQAADELLVMSRLGNAEIIDTPDTLYSFGGVWSPDGNTLAYFSSHPSNYSDIYTISFPDLSVRNLTQTETISEFNPLWSPDGTQLLYRRDGDLYLLTIETGANQLLIDLSAIVEMPVWSPDGQSLAFYLRRYVDGRNTLEAYIISRDAQQLSQLTLPLTINSPLSWSPDNQYLTLIAENTNLIIYDIAADSLQRIAGDNRRFAPAWSPNGRWIAFIENRQLQLYDVTTSEIHHLQTEGRIKVPLIWRP